MREILFRGKRTYNGEWVYGSLTLPCPFYKNELPTITYYVHPEGQEYPTIIRVEVIPETVGQYTGLNDKNGKKIFEGDVAKCTFCYDVGQYPRYETHARMVEFKISGFYPFTKSTHDPCEIIGNIHDNPELVEVLG